MLAALDARVAKVPTGHQTKRDAGNTEGPPCQFVKGRIWKIILKRIETKDGQQELYGEVKLLVKQTIRGKLR